MMFLKSLFPETHYHKVLNKAEQKKLSVYSGISCGDATSLNTVQQVKRISHSLTVGKSLKKLIA